MSRKTPQRYSDIERIADSLTPGYERNVLRVVALGPGDPATQERMRKLLRDGRQQEAIMMAMDVLQKRGESVSADMAKARSLAMSRASRVTQFGSEFPPSWEQSVNYAQDAVNKTLTNIAKQAWTSGGELLRRSVEEGWDVDETAKRLRSSLGVGQHRMQQILAAQAKGRYKTSKQFDRAVGKAIRNRAETIARTGLIDAANAGQDMAWRKAAAEGILDLSQMERVWTVGYDERLCPICEPLGGEARGMEEVFSIGVLRPPAHARCRCSLGMRRKRAALREQLRTQAREAAKMPGRRQAAFAPASQRAAYASKPGKGYAITNVSNLPTPRPVRITTRCSRRYN